MVDWYDDFIPSYNRDITKAIKLTDDWVYIYEPGKEIHEGYFYNQQGQQYGMTAERDDKLIYARIFLTNWHRDGWHFDFEIPIGDKQVLVAWEILTNTEMMWVATGRTYDFKDELREFGMRWHPALRIWYSEDLPEYHNPKVFFRQVPAEVLDNREW